MSNDQDEYAYLGAKWLFEQLGGKGDVVYMRGIAGASADNDRDEGLQGGPRRVPGHQDRQGGLHRLAAGRGQAADARHHRQRHAPSTASGPPASTTSSSMPWSRKASSKPDRGRGQRRFVQLARHRRGPPGRRGHQPRLDRRRWRDAGPPDPQRRDADVPADEAPRWCTSTRSSGRTSRPRASRPSKAAARPGPRQRVAGRHHDPRLDHLHQGPDHRLQGPAASSPNPSEPTSEGCGRLTPHPSTLVVAQTTVPMSSGSPARTDGLILEASGVVKTYGAGAALRDASLAVRPARCTRCWAPTAPASPRWSRS